MRMVWLPFVLPICNEAIVPPKFKSTKLFTLETATPPAPASKNFTSSKNSGASVGDQLFVFDQLFAPAPGPFQMIFVAPWLETVNVKLVPAICTLESVTEIV